MICYTATLLLIFSLGPFPQKTYVSAQTITTSNLPTPIEPNTYDLLKKHLQTAGSGDVLTLDKGLYELSADNPPATNWYVNGEYAQ